MLLTILLTILIGALIGWIAGLIMKSSHGFWINCLLGLIGSWLGFAIARAFGLDAWLWKIIIEIGGTCLVIFIARLIFGKKW